MFKIRRVFYIITLDSSCFDYETNIKDYSLIKEEFEQDKGIIVKRIIPEEKKTDTKHTPVKCNCNKSHCNICDGGLVTCSVCGASEGELTTECPGYKLPRSTMKLVFEGEIDYISHRWVITKFDKD